MNLPRSASPARPSFQTSEQQRIPFRRAQKFRNDEARGLGPHRPFPLCHRDSSYSRSLHSSRQMFSAHQRSFGLRRLTLPIRSLHICNLHRTGVSQNQGLYGHPFTAGTNPNFTNVELEQGSLPSVVPVKTGASPVQLCITLSPNNRTCPGAEWVFEVDYLCGGPLTTG